MGVKSTTTLKREAAENLYAEYRAREMMRRFRSDAVAMTNSQLEDAIEKLNDKYYRDELNHDCGFDNYSISEYEG